MGWIQNINIGVRIVGLVMIMLLTVVAGFSLTKLNSIGDEIHGIAEQDLPLIEKISELEAIVVEELIVIMRVLISNRGIVENC